MKILLKVSGMGNVTRVLRQREHSAESVMYSVEYTAPHAIIVHEDLDAYHDPPTQAKFLEAPYRALRRDMVEFIRDAMNRGQTLRQGAFRAMQKLLRASRFFVPVETGELKASGRINREK